MTHRRRPFGRISVAPATFALRSRRPIGRLISAAGALSLLVLLSGSAALADEIPLTYKIIYPGGEVKDYRFELNEVKLSLPKSPWACRIERNPKDPNRMVGMTLFCESGKVVSAVPVS